jgi:hypothetical protein
VLKKKRSVKEITMAKVLLNDGQYLYAVNDFLRLSDNSRDIKVMFINIYPKRAYPSRSR